MYISNNEQTENRNMQAMNLAIPNAEFSYHEKVCDSVETSAVMKALRRQREKKIYVIRRHI